MPGLRIRLPWILYVGIVLGIPLIGSTYSPLASQEGAICEPLNTVSNQSLYDDFSGPAIDLCKWIIVRENWGGKRHGEDYNGGVIPENVSLRDHILVLTALGNLYNGPVLGVDSSGNLRDSGQRSGAAVMTRHRYLGGRFEAHVRIIGHPGVVSAMWVFFYDEMPSGTVRNHEIDIEFPGNANADSAPSFDHVTLTTWTGIKPGETTAAFRALQANIADGKFHLLTFEWRPPAAGDPGSVAFFIDNKQLAVTRTNVPSEPSNLWLGAWFPQDWAGVPDFGEAEMLVDWVRITPLAPKADSRP